MTDILGIKKIIPPDILLQAYGQGYFPMAQTKHSHDFFWVDPPMRCIIPLDHFHVSRSLQRILKKNIFVVTINRAFADVISYCQNQSIRPRNDSWISPLIKATYLHLHTLKFAHSIECWQNHTLAGGLYGVSLKSAFFAESMFSLQSNASKVALHTLVHHLQKNHFTLLDVQMSTPHLQSMGAIDIPSWHYRNLLQQSLAQHTCSF